MTTQTLVTESAAVDILVGLDDARLRVPEQRWADLCLDTLVHVANVDGGVLVDQYGTLVSSIGLRTGSARFIAGMLAGGHWEEGLLRDAGVLATVPCPAHRHYPTLALCSDHDLNQEVDLVAVDTLMAPLFSMLASLRSTSEEVA
jgi:hypothetical protein